MKPGDTVPARDGAVQYLFHRHHRKRHPQKSRWTIKLALELSCFENAAVHGWCNDEEGWGLHIVEGTPQLVGRSVDDTDLGIAYFSGDTGVKPPLWHGYPADYRRRSEERPPVEVLQAWRQRGYIDKQTMVRVREQKPCRLCA